MTWAVCDKFVFGFYASSDSARITSTKIQPPADLTALKLQTNTHTHTHTHTHCCCKRTDQIFHCKKGCITVITSFLYGSLKRKVIVALHLTTSYNYGKLSQIFLFLTIVTLYLILMDVTLFPIIVRNQLSCDFVSPNCNFLFKFNCVSHNEFITHNVTINWTIVALFLW